MSGKKRQSGGSVAELRLFDVLLSQRRPAAEPVCTISEKPLSDYRWCEEFGGYKARKPISCRAGRSGWCVGCPARGLSASGRGGGQRP